MRQSTFSVYLICTILIAFVFTGCNIDSIRLVGDENVTRLEIALPQSRIALGDKSGDAYSVHWSQGDRVVVNGVLSEKVKIDVEDRSRAQLEIEGVLNPPFEVTYPYCSSATADTPKVEFLAEQAYTQGSFAEGSVPMCGYVARRGDAVAMRYLAGVLKFRIKASKEDISLQKIVVTSLSGAKLSGEFAVDCATATVVAAERTHNSTTCLFPQGFKLSTANETDVYIAVPATEVGSCLIEIVESSGEKMECKWNPTTPIKGGYVREFQTITYKAEICRFSVEQVYVGVLLFTDNLLT